MANVCVGPAFGVDGQGRLQLDLCGDPPQRAWPFPCPPADGNALRVDPDCGLWAPPAAAVAFESAFGSTTGVNQEVTSGFQTVEQASINVTNPSSCYPARGVYWVGVNVELDLPSGSDATAAARVDGTEYQRVTNTAPPGGTFANSVHWGFTHVTVAGPIISVGGSATPTFDIEVGGGHGDAHWRKVRWRVTTLIIAGLS